MQSLYLEAGRVTSPHGVHGEVKIEPWADSPDLYRHIKRLYIDGTAVTVLAARVHKSSVIAQLEGIERLEDAELLRNKTVFIDRDDIKLTDGQYFIARSYWPGRH